MIVCVDNKIFPQQSKIVFYYVIDDGKILLKFSSTRARTTLSLILLILILQPLPLHRLSMTESIVIALQSLLLPQGHGVGSPLAQHLPIHGADANLIANQVCRVVAEIRTRQVILVNKFETMQFSRVVTPDRHTTILSIQVTSISDIFSSFVFRACKVLASHLKDLTFASAFIQHSSATIDILKSLAKDCSTGNQMQLACLINVCRQSIVVETFITLLNSNIANI